jgi:hypothetical protein
VTANLFRRGHGSCLEDHEPRPADRRRRRHKRRIRALPHLFELDGFGVSTAGHTWQTVATIGISVFGPFATQAAVGLCLLWWNSRIVDKARLVPEKDEIVEAADLENIEITLVAVLGLYFIADGVAELIRSSLSWGIRHRIGHGARLLLGHERKCRYAASAAWRCCCTGIEKAKPGSRPGLL